MSPPPGDRPRATTLPPLPPGRDRDIWEQILHLQRDVRELDHRDGQMLGRLESMDDTLKSLNATLTTVVTERGAEAKRSQFWSNVKTSILGGVGVVVVIALIRMMTIVQSAKLP